MIKAELDNFKETIIAISRWSNESRKESNADVIEVVMDFEDDTDDSIQHKIIYRVEPKNYNPDDSILEKITCNVEAKNDQPDE